MAKKLVNRVDILDDLINVVTPKYFPDITLDKNRTSIYGYITEAMANSIEDTITLEQRRAADYCPELSNSAIHVRQTAKIRGVGVNYAQPGRCFAIIGILKSDILDKGTKVGNEIQFLVDRRSTILHDNINFSLEDDILIRAVRKTDRYVYAANYTGEHSNYDSYIQMFEQVNDVGEEMVTMIVQIYQCNYNIQEKVVTDEIQFLYDGIPFDYNNRLADFEVYYKQTSNDTYKRLDTVHYLTTEATEAIYYNDDDDNILFILNNPALNISVNATIRVEIKETLGTDGMINIGDSNTTFSLYRDGTYNYAGVNVLIELLSDTIDASNGDTLAEIKARLIDAKTRRDNITTEHDIISYINDIDANVQIIKKRNDIEDRRYYMYTLLRYNDEIVPANTKRLHIYGVQSATDWGDFDWYDNTVDRKVIRAYNKFKLVVPIDASLEDYAIKVSRDEPEDPDGFYYTCPFMILINNLNIASYYFTSVNDSIMINMRNTNNIFPYQVICRQVDIYRDSHNPETYDQYRFTVHGTLNTSNDSELIDDEGNIIDHDAIICYIVFQKDHSPVAYLPMNIDSYNQDTREFTFTGDIHTSDYITEQDLLEIPDGLYRNTSNDENYNSVIDFKDAQFDVYFMYKYDDVNHDYEKSDIIYSILPSSRTDGYMLMCAYYNNPNNLYDLILEYNKFTSSPVKVEQYKEGAYMFNIGEVPFIKYDYGISNIINMYDTFENMALTYGSLLKLTTDFEVSLKFIATYGASKYITVTGGLYDGEEIVNNLHNLNPTFYFKVYGNGVNVNDVRDYIYRYLRDTYITDTTIYISNICTLVEQNFDAVKSIKYMGVDNMDASFQEFTYVMPDFINVDIITRFVPEQLNVTDIQIDLDET